MATTRTPRETVVRVLAWGATAVWLALLVWLAVAGVAPGVAAGAPGWLVWLATPGFAAMTVAVVLSGLAFGLLVASYGRVGRRVPLLLSAWAAAGAIPLALLSYLPCPGDVPPFWDALLSTLSLFLGGYEDRFAGAACSYPAPLAVHVARMLALLATASGATSVVLTLSLTQLDRLALLRATSVTAVVGLDGASWGLVDQLAGRRRTGRRTVLLSAEIDDAGIERARAAGLLALRTHPDDLLGARLGLDLHKLSRIFLLSSDGALNRARAVAVRALLAGRATETTPVLVARIDDPWEADHWRKGLIGDPWVAADAIGLYEATSAALVSRFSELAPSELLIIGDDPLALALCTELSQWGRELQFLGDAAALPAVRLLGLRAAELAEDHELLEQRFASDPLEVTGRSVRPDLATVLAELPHDPSRVAVVITQEGTRLGTQLAIRFPNLPVFERTATDAPLTAEPTIGSLVGFGLSLAGTSAGATDAWERAAQLVHERYRRRFPSARLAVPWTGLSEFHRESNRRQLDVVRRELVGLGRTWRPASAETTTIDPDLLESPDQDVRISAGLTLFGLTRDELVRLARAEHDSWSRHLKADGWTQAAARDDAARQHPDLVAWEELPEATHQKVEAGVVDTLFQLRALGFRAVFAGSGEGWRSYERTGEVRARRLTAPYRWRTKGGDELVGEPGDWLITDGTGGPRTITDDSFRATHSHTTGNRWKRTGQVQARPIQAGEQVATQEGMTTAPDGSWLVTDADGNSWTVPDAHFRQAYRVVG